MGTRSRFFPLCPGCPPRLRFFDFFGGRALGLAAGPSDEGGFEELEESFVRNAIFRSNSATLACNDGTTAASSTIRSMAASGFPYTSALASSLVMGRPRTYSLTTVKRLPQNLRDIARLRKTGSSLA